MFERHREKGTLYNIKQVFDHRGMSHNIMECFSKAEELLEFATKGYLILAAMEILNLKSVDDVIDDSKEQLDTILSDVSKAIVDHIYQKSNTNEIINVAVDKFVATSLHCVCKLEVGGDMIYCFNKNCQFGQWFHLECIGLSEDDIPEVSWFCSDICRNEKASARGKKKKTVVDKFRDLKKEYVETLIWRGLNEMIRRDAIKENDGPRMIRHWKADMPELFENNHPKYFIFAHRLLANIAGATSARLREQMIWNRTVNAVGGARNNIPKDLHCEHLNRQYKENSRDAGGQLTEATINRHSQMLGIGKVLETVYQEQIVSSRAVKRHHTRHEMDTDLKQFVKTMKPLRLLEHIPGRYFKGFENLKQTKGVTHPKKFKERIMRHTAKMANLRELVLNI